MTSSTHALQLFCIKPSYLIPHFPKLSETGGLGEDSHTFVTAKFIFEPHTLSYCYAHYLCVQQCSK